MKLGIVGTGAVGGYFGAKFALAGLEVVFFCRGANLDAYKSHGLQLETNGQMYTIKDAVFSDDPEILKNLDYLLFTVKSYHTQQTAIQIAPFLSAKTIVITPQNGISNDIILREILGKNRVLPGMAQIGVFVPKPGIVRHVSLGILKIGEYDGQISPRVQAFARICKNADIECIVSSTIQVDRWKKFIWNCTFNIIAAITRLRLDQILEDNDLAKLCISTIKEIQAVAVAEGISFGDEDVVTARMNFAKKLGKFKPSTLEDIEKGKPIELDAFTGVVRLLAQKHGIGVPVNDVLYSLLHGITVRSS